MMRKADLVFTTADAIYSEAIKWFTQSLWSHVMVATGNGEEVISADAGGVCVRDMEPEEKERSAVLHYPQLYDWQAGNIVRAMASLIGKKYDYFGTFVGIPLNDPDIQDPGKWFCSESAFWAYLQGPVILLERIRVQMVTPQHLWISPLERQGEAT